MDEREELNALRRLAELEAKAAGRQYDGTPPEEGFGERMSRELSSVPRQLGLTARAVIQGVADVADLVASPVYAGLNAAGANLDTPARLGARAADAMGLPKSETPTERVVGDASRMLAGGGGMVAGAGKLAQLPGTAGRVMTSLAANPGAQVAGAGAGGAAGAYTKETGGGPGAQFVAALAGGVAGGMTAPIVQNVTRSIAQKITAMRPNSQAGQDLRQQIDITISQAMSENGITLAELPADILNGLRADVAKAMSMQGIVSKDALRRLADYRQAGATPTRASLTLDPVDVTQQKNLAKVGANSSDETLQMLSRAQHENNATLIDGMNRAGAGNAPDALAAGGQAITALERLQGKVKSKTDSLYDAARNTQGRSADLDPSYFTQRASDLLDQALLGSKLPDDVRGLLNKVAGAQMPFTVDVAEQLKTRIGDLQRGSNEPSVRKALGMVRQALEETPLLPGQQIGQESIDAFNMARAQHRKWMKMVESTPALERVVDGAEPDQFVREFIIGSGKNANVSGVMKLANALKTDKQAKEAIKYHLALHLKEKALNGASDEVGNFSQSAFNKEMKRIGDAKLKLFFSKAELDQLKVIGRVASYEQVQPKGSAVNNSNSGALVLGQLIDRLGKSSLLQKIPLGPALIGEPLTNISIGFKSKRAANVPNALLRQPSKAQREILPMTLLAPALQLDRE
jgi:hypothetical protein